MPQGQEGTFLWLCVCWGRDKGAPGEKNDLYLSKEQISKPFCPSRQRAVQKGMSFHYRKEVNIVLKGVSK